MRNVGEVRLVRNPEKHKIIKQAVVGVLSLRRAPKLGKLLVCFASICSSCDLRPPPNRKGLGPPAP